MKRLFQLITLSSLLLFPIGLFAQGGKLWGVTYAGGANNAGAIFQVNADGSSCTSLWNFDNTDSGPSFPYAGLVRADNGKLYGTTYQGGTSYPYAGTIYEYDPIAKQVSFKYEFDLMNGGYPISAMVKSSVNSKLYGTNNFGGADGYSGVLFEYDPNSNSYVIKIDFSSYGISGPNYNEPLVEGFNGKLYGTTFLGGLSSSYGSLFEYDVSTNTFTVLHNFGLPGDGAFPFSGLTRASNGKLYGTTSYTDTTTPGGGVLYEFDPNFPHAYNIVFDFSSSDMLGSTITMTSHSNGKLYGTTPWGGVNHYGALFEFDPGSLTVTKKFDFDSVSTGAFPWACLTISSNGRLYGTAITGGAYGYGVLFEYDPLTNSFEKKFDFDGTNGANPYAALIFAKDDQTVTFNSLPDKTFGDAPFLLTATASSGLRVTYTSSDPSVVSIYADTAKIHKAGTVTITAHQSGDSNYNAAPVVSQTLVVNPGSSGSGGLPDGTSQGEIWGTTFYGGTNGQGTIFRFTPDGADLSAVYQFSGADLADGTTPIRNNIVQAADGNLYGVTIGGGSQGIFGRGVFFKLDPIDSSYTKLFDFDESSGSVGAIPTTITRHSDGKIYGTTLNGGQDGLGTLYVFDPIAGTRSRLIEFDGSSNGAYPNGLLSASNGKLYATTLSGGPKNQGILFEYDPVSGVLVNKYDFNRTDGGYTQDIIQAANGKLYGTTRQGGANSKGVLYEFDLATNAYTKLYDFSGSGFPIGPLVESNDLIFGTTAADGIWAPQNSTGNKLFQFDTQNLTLTNLIDFSVDVPTNGLFKTNNGKIYGQIQYGNSYGYLFEYDQVNNVVIKRIEFNGVSNGASPSCNLSELSIGKLMGMTKAGGIGSAGVIFEFDPTNNSSKKRFDFAVNKDGGGPMGSLKLHPNGKYYGTSAYGSKGFGVIYQFEPSTLTYTKLVDFDGDNGASPFGNLVLAPNGKFYGASFNGGANNLGSIFEFDPSNNSVIKKADFTKASGGPGSDLFLSSGGKLYGTTSFGGANKWGVIFSLDTQTGIFTIAYDFNLDYVIGGLPGSLSQAPNGKYYGTTFLGAALGYGCLFEFDPANNTIIKKIDFTFTTGPTGPLILHPNGKLYAASSIGGLHNTGFIVEYDPTTNILTNKYDLPLYEPAANRAELVLSPFDHKFYGATMLGGSYDAGLVYSYDPVNEIFNIGYEFKRNDFVVGQFPNKGLLITKARQNIQFNSLQSKTFDDLPFDLTAVASSGLNVTFKSSDPAIASVSGSTVTILKAGTVTITAQQNGNSYYNAAPDAQQTLIINKADQTTTFNSLPPKTFGDGSFDLSATTTSGLSTSFASSDPTIASISGSTVTILKAGTVTITAQQSGDSNYNSAQDVQQILMINKADQTTTFNSLSPKTFGDASFNLSATTSSGLTVTYTSSDPTIVSIAGSTATILKAGTITITASQSGDSNYNAAQDVQQTLTINKAEQTVTFDPLPVQTFGDTSFDLPATTSSGLPITYTSSDPTIVSISGSTLIILKAGTVTITAHQSGDSNYDAAQDTQQILTIDKADQVITFPSQSDKTIGGTSFEFNATVSSGLTIAYLSQNGKVSITGNQATIISAGRESIVASQDGNENYNAAQSSVQSFCIDPSKPTFTQTLSSGEVTLTSLSTAGNQWYLNGNEINGAADKTYVAVQAGEYKLKVSVDDCESEFSENATIIITGDIRIHESISLFPNPADHSISIKGADPTSEIIVFDALGKQQSIQFVEELDKLKGDVRHLSAGVYAVRVSFNNQVQMLRFVKQ